MSAALAMTRPDQPTRPARGRIIGTFIACLAGAVWAWVPARLLPVPAPVAHAIVVAVALLLFVSAIRPIATSAGRRPGAPVDRKLMALSIAGEVVAILIGVNLVANLGRPDLILSVVGLVVGLHFLPLAKACDFPAYRILGLAITAFALVSIAVPGPVGHAILGGGAAASLWLTVLATTLRLRHMNRMRSAA